MKKKINKVIVHHLAEEIMLDANLLNIDLILQEFDDIFYLMDYVKQIDTSEVVPLDYPFETERSYLRDDQATDCCDQADLLATAPAVEGDFVIVNEVIS